MKLRVVMTNWVNYLIERVEFKDKDDVLKTIIKSASLYKKI